jgi:hypothetical protein
VQAKRIHNIFYKIITENFPNLIQLQEDYRTPNRQNRTSPQHIILNTASTKNKERILKTVGEKNETTCKGKSIKITDFST